MFVISGFRSWRQARAYFGYRDDSLTELEPLLAPDEQMAANHRTSSDLKATIPIGRAAHTDQPLHVPPYRVFLLLRPTYLTWTSVHRFGSWQASVSTSNMVAGGATLTGNHGFGSPIW